MFEAADHLRAEFAQLEAQLADPEVHAEGLRAYVDAGVDEIYIQQIGPDQVAAMRFYRDEVLPRL